MRILPVGVGLGATVLASAAAAQVNQSYAYDANGRLVGVTTSGSAGSNAASYTYDDANNRTLRGQSGVSSWAALRRLPVDGLLSPHQALTSPDGTWSLALRSSGRLESPPPPGSAAREQPGRELSPSDPTTRATAAGI